MKYWEIVADNSAPLAGRGIIAAPLPEMAGGGVLDAGPKRIGLKSNRRLSRVLIKSSLISSPDVSTHLRPD